MNLSLLLVKIGILKLKPKSIKKWSNKNNIELIEYAAENGDFWCRSEVAKVLINFQENQSRHILINLLHDKVFTVAEHAIESLNTFDLNSKIINEINSVLKQWEEKEQMIKENWDKPAHSNQGLYIDKSQMKRLNQLKNLLSKQKGSMSIG